MDPIVVPESPDPSDNGSFISPESNIQYLTGKVTELARDLAQFKSDVAKRIGDKGVESSLPTQNEKSSQTHARGDKSTQTPVGDETSSQTPVRNETSSQTSVRAEHDTGSIHTTADKTPVQQPNAADTVKSTEQIYTSQLDEYKHKHQQRRLQANEQQNIHPGYHNHNNGSNNRIAVSNADGHS